MWKDFKSSNASNAFVKRKKSDRIYNSDLLFLFVQNINEKEPLMVFYIMFFKESG